MEDLLPIGSVIKLKGPEEKRLMICGRAQSLVDDSSSVYDYSGCLYPEGIMDIKKLYLFNNADIEGLYFIGLQDQEEFELRDHIKQFLAGQRDETES